MSRLTEIEERLAHLKERRYSDEQPSLALALDAREAFRDHAPADIEYLLGEVRRLREALTRIKRLPEESEVWNEVDVTRFILKSSNGHGRIIHERLTSAPEQPDWIEKLRAEPAITMNRLWPLLCDVVEAAAVVQHNAGDDAEAWHSFVDALAALRVEVKRDA